MLIRQRLGCEGMPGRSAGYEERSWTPGSEKEEANDDFLPLRLRISSS